jgi:beta-glucosidase
LVVADYIGINEMMDQGIGNLQKVFEKALNAGIDMDIVEEGFLDTLKNSLGNGRAPLLRSKNRA